MKLTDMACRAAKAKDRLYKLSDGQGLQLWVFPNGSKLWRYAYRAGKKQKTLALGDYPNVKLADVREARNQARLRVKQGNDPSQERRIAKAIRFCPGNTFADVANDFVAMLGRGNTRSGSTMNKYRWQLRTANDELGRYPIASITGGLVLGVLRKIEADHAHSARRLCYFLGKVFRHGIIAGKCQTDPSYKLTELLASAPTTPRAAIVEEKKLADLLKAIDGYDFGQPSTKIALKLQALLFTRPGELRAAEWAEIDLENAVWTIPAAKMKKRRDHLVPLAPQALVLLRMQKRFSAGSKYVFPSIRTINRPMSNNTMNAALRRLGYTKDEVCPHGFRSTASTLLNEEKFPADHIERQLAHVPRNQTRGQYNRAEFWEGRVEMMKWWANKLDELLMPGVAKGAVFLIRSAK